MALGVLIALFCLHVNDKYLRKADALQKAFCRYDFTKSAKVCRRR